MTVLSRLGTWLGHIALAFAGIALLAMMAITVVDIVLRYLFQLTDGASRLTFTGGVELVQYLMLGAMLSAMAAHVEHSQVVVELFTRALSGPLKARLAGLYLLLFAAVGSLLAMGLFETARSLAEFGEVTQDLAIPKAPMYDTAAVLFAILALRSAIYGLRGLLQGVTHDA
ncbi:TRAP-type C4-dicarboxylate transport system permease small subunit [Kushneria sinocarnis]|uniref:TRAP transporter small permease protein n=1 Tax=Kushneria sinocarnis TaxID=595502 RepID=A0A420WWE4_9GAMM|nr:TRAP transporter small permease subunit [Kushneria sinocarnis]RKR03410.1 TRAP-type C4-dicarboxylate transport system permease small subunit [Kushneria sinocarnis]